MRYEQYQWPCFCPIMASMSLKLKARKYWHLVKTGWLNGLPASYRYGQPAKKLKIYGITGTDGKTTSSTLLYHVLKESGKSAALISTVAAFIGAEKIDTGFHVTSPDPAALQRLLNRCVEAGIAEVVLEVTSHGLYQNRVWGVPFELVGITNVTSEHLDYFETWDKLVEVKGSIFKKAKQAVLNQDDKSFAKLKALAKQANCPVTTFPQELPSGKVGRAVAKRFTEPYNQWNAHLIWKMAKLIGISDVEFIKAVKSFPGIKGRMEEIPNDLGIKVIVDFAHTSHGLESVLNTLREQTNGKLIAVYGCAGLRDRSKRPRMGEIGSRIADLAIFTAEDPRTEDVQVIMRQMKEGVKAPNHHKVMTIADRQQAINQAIELAKKGDTVALLGKGHEESMCYGKVEQIWSDQSAVISAIEARTSNN